MKKKNNFIENESESKREWKEEKTKCEQLRQMSFCIDFWRLSRVEISDSKIGREMEKKDSTETEIGARQKKNAQLMLKISGKTRAVKEENKRTTDDASFGYAHTHARACHNNRTESRMFVFIVHSFLTILHK